MVLTQNPPSSSPPVNTKIERVVEAIEGLSIAAAVATREPIPRGAFQTVRDKREEVAAALRDFLQPALRVVGGTDIERRLPVRRDDDPYRFGPPKKQ